MPERDAGVGCFGNRSIILGLQDIRDQAGLGRPSARAARHGTHLCDVWPTNRACYTGLAVKLKLPAVNCDLVTCSSVMLSLPAVITVLPWPSSNVFARAVLKSANRPRSNWMTSPPTPGWK